MDLGPHGIRVNSVSPGWIWTREVLKAAEGDKEKWGPVWGQVRAACVPPSPLLPPPPSSPHSPSDTHKPTAL